MDKKIKVSDYIIEFLLKKNINTIFTLSGGFIGPILNSILKYNIKYYCFNHEQSAAMAADAYARISLKPCCLLITNGPGASNTITGVIGAFQDSVPIYIISGQVPYEQSVESQELPLRQLGVQELSIIPIVKTFTKYSYFIKNKNELAIHLNNAYYECVTGRMGPTWIDIPLDIQNSYIENSCIENSCIENINEKCDSFDIIYNEIIDMINISKRPLFVIGHGIKLSKTENLFIEILKKTNIPVVTSWLGKDIINNDDKLFCGTIGILGERFSNFAIQKSDLLIILGCRLNITHIGYDTKSFSKESFKIMVDVDNNELEKKTININMKINKNLNIFLSEFNILLNKNPIINNFNLWNDKINYWKNKYPTINVNNINLESDVNSYYFSKYLSELIKPDTVIITDTGSSSFSIFQSLHINKSNVKLFTASGQCSMGYGLPGAIGAYISNNLNNIILIAGDGGFQLNIQELQTIIYYNLPIKIFILNNNGYLAIKLMQQNLFESKYVASTLNSGVSSPNFIKVAESYGLKTFTIKTNNDVVNNINEIINYTGPCLCNITMIHDQLIIPRVQSIGNKRSLEYMFPYIDEIELEKDLTM
jgi:acetolactate synthase-1/2/3 large subunit